MRKNYIEIPKKVYYPHINGYKTITFARTKKDLDQEIYETLDLPDWLNECIEAYAQTFANKKLNEFKYQIKNLFI